MAVVTSPPYARQVRVAANSSVSSVRRGVMSLVASTITVLVVAGCASANPAIDYDGARATSAPAEPRETFRAETLPIDDGSQQTMASVVPGTYDRPSVPDPSATTTEPSTTVPSVTSATVPGSATSTTEPARDTSTTEAAPVSIDVMPPGPPTVTGSSFPYDSLTEVPQLGVDPVRGSGCGVGEALGDQMPDGIWFGVLSRGATGGAIEVDVVCVYYGQSARALGASISRSGFYPVNDSDRQRRVPLAADFSYRAGTSNGFVCADPGPTFARPLSTLPTGTPGWIVVVDGQVELAVSIC